MAAKRDVLVVQLELHGEWGDRTDLDLYGEIKNELEYRLQGRNAGEVDGGDFGSGTMNIFLVTDALVRAVPIVKEYLGERGVLDRCRIAQRDYLTGDDWNYRVIWPEGERNQLLDL